MKQYTYIEYVAVEVIVNVENDECEDDADQIGSAYVDKLLYDAKTLRKRAAEIDTPGVFYKGADSTGETEVHLNGKLFKSESN